MCFIFNCNSTFLLDFYIYIYIYRTYDKHSIDCVNITLRVTLVILSASGVNRIILDNVLWVVHDTDIVRQKQWSSSSLLTVALGVGAVRGLTIKFPECPELTSDVFRNACPCFLYIIGSNQKAKFETLVFLWFYLLVHEPTINLLSKSFASSTKWTRGPRVAFSWSIRLRGRCWDNSLMALN